MKSTKDLSTKELLHLLSTYHSWDCILSILKNKNYKDINHLKYRIKKLCGVCLCGPSWNDRPLKLLFDKRKGIKVCPNCYFQLRKNKSPLRPVFLEKEITILGVDGVSRRYGVSKNKVGEWINNLKN